MHEQPNSATDLWTYVGNFVFRNFIYISQKVCQLLQFHTLEVSNIGDQLYRGQPNLIFRLIIAHLWSTLQPTGTMLDRLQNSSIVFTSLLVFVI